MHDIIELNGGRACTAGESPAECDARCHCGPRNLISIQFNDANDVGGQELSLGNLIGRDGIR